MIETSPGQQPPYRAYRPQPIVNARARSSSFCRRRLHRVRAVARLYRQTSSRTGPGCRGAPVVRQNRTGLRAACREDQGPGSDPAVESIDQPQVVQDPLQTVRRRLRRSRPRPRLSEQVSSLKEAIDGLRQSFCQRAGFRCARAPALGALARSAPDPTQSEAPAAASRPDGAGLPPQRFSANDHQPGPLQLFTPGYCELVRIPPYD